MKCQLHLVGLVVAALATAARADVVEDGDDRDIVVEDGDDRDIDDGERHVATAAAWAAIKLAIPAWYYWRTQEAQEVDWTRPTWKDKLTLRSIRFDTNAFHVNAIRHPLTGIGDYQIARSNGYGVAASTLFAYLSGAVWELAIEYYEDPSLNDLIMNGAGGLAIGEPLYQIGQLWRGGEPSPADRIRSAAFSPFAATQDLWRTHRAWPRRRAWSDVAFSAGALGHRIDRATHRNEVAIGMDIDVVRHRGFVVAGSHAAPIAPIAPGAWSRVALGVRLGDSGRGEEVVATSFRSRTSIAGSYRQDDGGRGELRALGAAFTYRRDRLAAEWDRLAIAHLIGPQLQLSRRGALELRWDLAGYADFGLITAHVFGPTSPLPRSPPYLSTLQVQGYDNAAGASIESRVRADHGAWHLDVEVAGHQLWSLDFADRVQQTADASRTQETAGRPIPAAPHGVSDLRVHGHAQLGARAGRWGIAATAEAAVRRGRWRELERSTGDWTLGVLATANL